ncbi:MAG: HEAT repeat domain-containing protein [Cyanobacteria bacterium P01_A01_bin.68]
MDNLSLYSYESPEKIPKAILIKSLKSDLASEFLLDWASTQPDREIALTMLMNPKTSQQQLETLFETFDTHFGLDDPWAYKAYFQEEYKYYRDALDILCNIDAHINWEHKELEENWQEEILYQIIKLEYWDRNIEDYPDSLGKFLSLDLDLIFNQIIQKANYRSEVKDFFIEAKLFTIAHQSTDVGELRKVLSKKGFRYKYAILRNPNLPVEILEKILDKILKQTKHIYYLYHQEFDRIFKQYPTVTEKIFKNLYQYENKHKQKNNHFIAGSPHAPLWILEELAKSSDLEILCCLASNSKCTEAILLELTTKELADSDRESLARNLYGNPNCPYSVLSKLGEIPKTVIRERIVASLDTPASKLRRIAEQSDDWSNSFNYRIRIDVARNNNTDLETLQMLASDQDWEVRLNVVKNLNTTIEILRGLAQDESEEVRFAVLANPNFTKKDFYELMRDIYGRSNYSLGCLLALLDPDISPKILEENADSLLWNERFIIAIHPKTKIETIQRLSNDGNFYVRAAALERL